MFDTIVNTATAAKNVPAPRGPSRRVTTIARTNANTPETVNPTRFRVPPRASRRSSGVGASVRSAVRTLDTPARLVGTTLDRRRRHDAGGDRERQVRTPLQRPPAHAPPRPASRLASAMQRRVRERDAAEKPRGVRVVVEQRRM